MPIRAGSLRDFVTIQRAADGLSTAGQPGPAWVDFASLWAFIEPWPGRRGGEAINARTLESQMTTRVHTRFVDGIMPGMRIVLGSRKFRVQAINDIDNRHRELELICVEVQ